MISPMSVILMRYKANLPHELQYLAPSRGQPIGTGVDNVVIDVEDYGGPSLPHHSDQIWVSMKKTLYGVWGNLFQIQL